MKIEAKSVTFNYGDKDVLKDVSFTSDSGEIVAFLGPNGVGKSTLFKCLLGFLKPQKGEVLIDDKNVLSYSDRERAKAIAYIPQSFNPVYNHTVLESVLMGYANTIPLFSMPGEEEKKRAEAILSSMSILSLKDRGTKKISGGEKSLMLLSRALMQDAKILIMDEPTASLDFANSHRVMKKIVELKEKGYTIIFSTHSPLLATEYSTKIVALRDGKVLKEGSADEVMTSEMLSKLYSYPITVETIEIKGKKHFILVPGEENGQNR